jgi:N-formylglutamate amidohydrolase
MIALKSSFLVPQSFMSNTLSPVSMPKAQKPEMAPPAIVSVRPKLKLAVDDTGLIFCLPHSGSFLPSKFLELAAHDPMVLRSTEDAYVDALIDFEHLDFIWGIRSTHSRAYVDVNRHPLELDPRLIEGALPRGCLSQTLRVKSGYGVIPRCLTQQTEIHQKPISYQEAINRLAQVHTPYHQAIKSAISEALGQCQKIILMDWHSMPSTSGGGARKGPNRLALPPSTLPDIVLGDLHGQSCEPELTRFLKEQFEAQGLKVGLNHPFAGGYTLEVHADRHKNIQAIQVEINRGLYMDERTLKLKPEGERLKSALEAVIVALKAY